MAATIEVLLSS